MSSTIVAEVVELPFFMIGCWWPIGIWYIPPKTYQIYVLMLQKLINIWVWLYFLINYSNHSKITLKCIIKKDMNPCFKVEKGLYMGVWSYISYPVIPIAYMTSHPWENVHINLIDHIVCPLGHIFLCISTSFHKLNS